jgi:glycosyltransferase involved in cell wall biosynthesis
MISLDTAILTESYGNALERQTEYARHLGRLTILILNTLNNQSKPLDSIEQKNLRVIPTNSVSRWHTIIDGYRIGSATLRSKQNISINLITSQDAFISGLIGAVLKKKFQLPLSIQIHATDLVSSVWQQKSTQNKLLTFLSTLTLPQADTIRYGSDQSLMALQEMVPALTSKSFKAPVYVDTSFFDKKVIKKSTIKKIVTVGRLDWAKNHLQLLEAFDMLLADHPDLRLTIVGGGSQEHVLWQKTMQMGLSKQVSITGYASKDQVKQYLHDADLFVFPSFYEGWGMAVVEAVAAGVPVVMTNVGCAGELIVNNKTGVVFEDVSTQGIYAALSSAITNPQKLSIMAKAAQDILKNNYQKETLITNFLECLHETAA